MDISVTSLKLWSLYVGGDTFPHVVPNFNLGIHKGIWGSENDDAFTQNEHTVSSGDYIIFTCGYKRKKGPEYPNKNRYKNVAELINLFVQFNRLAIARVTSNCYRDDTPIWEDAIYPFRFKFELIERYENFPLSRLTEVFSNENLDVLRRSMIPPAKTRRLNLQQISLEKLGVAIVNKELSTQVQSDLAAMEHEIEYWEGKQKERYTNYYERNPALRVKAIETHGTTCMACSFNFDKTYPDRGRDFIEVHHIKPVSELGQNTKIDPGSDLIVLCSNCHRMIHRRKDNILSLENLRNIIKQAGIR